MSPLFGKSKQRGALIALIDIESGSVGSALASVSPGIQPKLLAQRRNDLDVRDPQADILFNEVERELEQSFLHLNTFISRAKEHMGSEGIDRVAVFLHSPWVASERALERVVPKAHDPVLDRLKAVASGYVGGVPLSFHSFSTTVTPIITGIFNPPQDAVVCSIGGEITELLRIQGNKVDAHATIPVGVSTIVRTIATHAGVSKPEALSILTLSRTTREHLWAEAIASAMKHFANQVREGFAVLEIPSDQPQHIFVLSSHSASDWFAKTLTQDDPLHELFYPGSTVRALHPKYISSHLSGHPHTPDVPLSLESLFVDTRFGA